MRNLISKYGVTNNNNNKDRVRISDMLIEMEIKMKKFRRLYKKLNLQQQPSIRYGLRVDYIEFLNKYGTSQKGENYRCNLPEKYRNIKR